MRILSNKQLKYFLARIIMGKALREIQKTQNFINTLNEKMNRQVHNPDVNLYSADYLKLNR